jgi:hypothetical protein
MNRFYSLPREIQSQIYSYDNTYRDLFTDCLHDIQYKLYIRYEIDYVSCDTYPYYIEVFRFNGIDKTHKHGKQRQQLIEDTYGPQIIYEIAHTMEASEYLHWLVWFWKLTDVLISIA